MRNKCIFLFSTINLPTTTACGICNTSRSFLPVRKIPFYARLRPSGCHAPTSADAPSVSGRPLLQHQPPRSNFAFVPIRFVRRIIFKQVFACLNTFRSLRIIWARLRNNSLGYFKMQRTRLWLHLIKKALNNVVVPGFLVAVVVVEAAVPF